MPRIWLEPQQDPIPAGKLGELTIFCRHRTRPLAAHAKGRGNVLLRLFLRAFPEPKPIPKNHVIRASDVTGRNKEGRSHVKIRSCRCALVRLRVIGPDETDGCEHFIGASLGLRTPWI